MANANSADPHDPMVKEVMDELRAEGHTFEGDAPKEEPKPQEAKPEPKKEEPAPKAEEPAEEVAEVEKPKPEAKPERRSKYVPVSKANQWRHEAQEAKAKADELAKELEELKKTPQTRTPKEDAGDWESSAAEIAKKHGLDEAVVKDLVGVMSKAIPRGLDPALKSEIDSLRSVKVKYEADAEEAAFREDLNKTITEFPELKGQDESLRELAYAEGNEKVPLRLLALQLRHDLNLDKPPAKTIEGSVAAPTAEAVDYSEMSEEKLRSLSDDEFEKFIEWQEKNAKTKLGKFR